MIRPNITGDDFLEREHDVQGLHGTQFHGFRTFTASEIEIDELLQSALSPQWFCIMPFSEDVVLVSCVVLTTSRSPGSGEPNDGSIAGQEGDERN